MNKILSKFFEIIKIIFFVASIVLVLFGILSTYSRLQKSLTEAINIFIPFILLFILTAIRQRIGGRKKYGYRENHTAGYLHVHFITLKMFDFFIPEARSLIKLLLKMKHIRQTKRLSSCFLSNPC